MEVERGDVVYAVNDTEVVDLKYAAVLVHIKMASENRPATFSLPCCTVQNSPSELQNRQNPRITRVQNR